MVVTILLMVLLSILAVGMLSLSGVTLRSSSQSSAMTEARANARMALMIAIGELQKQMGPDQRISGNAAILDSNADTSAIDGVTHPHWTGVWDSWVVGDPNVAPVNPNYPNLNDSNYNSHHQTIGSQSDGSMHPDYANKDKYFRKWLVSLPDASKATLQDTAKTLVLNGVRLPDKNASAVQLVGEKSLGSSANAADYVNAGLVPARETGTSAVNGRFAWWIGDESQKARVMEDSYAAQEADPNEPPLTSAEKIYRSQAPASTGTKMVPSLTAITDNTQLDKELASLASHQSLDLLSGLSGDARPSKDNFHSITTNSLGVLADVREGGLKRDLSTILEQQIDRSNSGDEYMLYAFDDPRFSDQANSRVPIQDLAAFYQLYDDDPDWSEDRRAGVRYSSGGLPDSIQAPAPDYGASTSDRQKFLRQYTALYSQPVIAKVQFLLAIGTQPITAADRQYVIDNAKQRNGQPQPPIRDSDTHKMRLGIMPMVTLWNPTNLPLVMDNEQFLRFGTPPFAIKYRKYRSGTPNDYYDYYYYNLNYAMGGDSVTTGVARGLDPHIVQFRFARNSPIIFEPGEVKVFSIPPGAGGTLTEGGNITSIRSTTIDPVNEWDPFGFFLVKNAVPQGPYGNEAPEAYRFADGGESMVLNPNNRLTYQIVTESPDATSYRDGRRISNAGEIYGAGFNLQMFDAAYRPNDWRNWLDFLRHYQMLSRHGNDNNAVKAELATFNADLMTPGFPGGEAPVEFKSYVNAIRCDQIIAASEDTPAQVTALMEFSLSIGCESGTLSNGGFGGGRRTASRPFLHSNPNAAPFIDSTDAKSLYNYGWDWQLGPLIDVGDSIIRGNPDDPSTGFYGGGYTSDLGTTHVVQRELPALPPISIAALSHAQLGGYSLAYSAPMGDDPINDTYWWKAGRMRDPIGTDYQQITATGQGGLAPQVAQAIGNSYAHPNIPAAKAFTTWTRLFDADEVSHEVPFVDHSYLGNKALWDEFFFSSITPQPSKVPLFGGSGQTAREVANEFFFSANASPETRLPNRRMTPYTIGFGQDQFDALFTDAQRQQFTDGLADKIAAHLMVDGALNINSTSVNAWKVFLSSLKGKPVAYLDGGTSPLEAATEGTTFSFSSLPDGEPIKTAEISSPNNPTNQWKSGRELTDEEIDQLANAITRQVKLRGPFLSLSEFINRRLDNSNPELSTKGALQAALDDPNVSINAKFREPSRMIDSETADISGFKFPDAAKGPIAYGSSAYVDQADILRSMSSQLTARGDTFVIRTYGDSLNANGEVVARAWCEAVVQRYPEYVDEINEPHFKQDALTEMNKKFGRKFQITSFRWLGPEEI